MRVLDKYILRSVFTIFFLCLVSFLFLYITIDIFSHLEDILKQKVSLDILKNYYTSYLPIIFIQVVPFTGLLSILYTFGKLNRDNEIMAMRSSGLSILQITWVVIVFGLIISLFMFLVNDRLVPKALITNQKFKELIESSTVKSQERENQTLNNLSVYGMGNRLFFVNRFSSDSSTMEGIIILEHDEQQNITRKIVASKGVFKDGIWTFYQCITYDFDINGQIKNEPRYLREEIINIPESPYEFLNQRQRPDFMTISQLQNYIWKLSKSGATGVIKNLKVDFYQRFTSSLTAIVIIILGIPFSFMMKKRATGLSSLGISLLVGFLYYVINAVSIALGKAGLIVPALSVSLSHIIALIFSVYLISRLP